ncbi:MAG: glutaredoxin [Nannocystaceae bacterium]|nr:glutaredoxin [bacterium]
MQRRLLADTAYTEHTASAVAGFHRRVIDEVAKAVEHEAVVVVGMAQNPVVKRARKALTQADIPFTYLEYGSYLSAWKERLALKMWSGWPTFPQVFVRGVLLGGNAELQVALADGSLRERLEG